MLCSQFPTNTQVILLHNRKREKAGFFLQLYCGVQPRKAVMTLLNDSEWSSWSNAEIARRCSVDDKTVARVREEISVTSEIRSEPAERTNTTKHGTVATMNSSSIGKQGAAHA